MKKYLKIFSKAVRRMKLIFYKHAYDINLYKVCVFLLSLSNFFGCFGNLKFPLSYRGKVGIVNFCCFTGDI